MRGTRVKGLNFRRVCQKIEKKAGGVRDLRERKTLRLHGQHPAHWSKQPRVIVSWTYEVMVRETGRRSSDARSGNKMQDMIAIATPKNAFASLKRKNSGEGYAEVLPFLLGLWTTRQSLHRSKLHCQSRWKVLWFDSNLYAGSTNSCSGTPPRTRWKRSFGGFLTR